MRRTRTLLHFALLVVAVSLSMASSRKVIKITERQHRVKIAAGFGAYSAQDQALIRSGKFRTGMDEYGLWVSRGEPSFYWHTWTGKTWCRVLLYGKEGGSNIDLAVYTCGARVAHWAKISPAIPCWRLKKVAPRALASIRYFERRTLDRQWEILTGLIRRKQSARDLAIMLGKPYNTGSQAREDGTNAATQVYLDSSGEAYGLHVTLIKGLVVGWKIPAARQLTPEAQARRLKATEKRLIAKMKEIEAAAVQRHREEMSLLSNIQNNQSQMMDTLVRRARKRMHRRRHQGGPGVRGVPGGGGHVRGGKRLTLNGCTYTDGPNGELGRACGGNRGGCSDGYACLVMAGDSGVCVPRGQKCSR